MSRDPMTIPRSGNFAQTEAWAGIRRTAERNRRARRARRTALTIALTPALAVALWQAGTAFGHLAEWVGSR